MIGSPCCLEADHDEIVELSSSSRRKEGLPPGHRGGRGEQPVHPRGGGGTPSPLVGWAGGRWLLGGRLAVRAAICWLLQDVGQNLDSHTEERLLCVTVKVRDRILQKRASGSSHGPWAQRQPLGQICPGNPTWPETVYHSA